MAQNSDSHFITIDEYDGSGTTRFTSTPQPIYRGPQGDYSEDQHQYTPSRAHDSYRGELGWHDGHQPSPHDHFIRETSLQREAAAPVKARETARPIMRPDRFDGRDDLSSYLQHFSLCATLNQWDDTEKAQYLALSLTGEARQVINGLHVHQLRDFHFIVSALQNRFDPIGRTELHQVQLKNRVRGQNESLAELADGIRILVERVYGDLPVKSKDKMARDHFIDALNDSEMRTRILQARTTTLRDTVTTAIELEALQTAERERNNNRRVRAVTSTHDKDVSADLMRAVSDLATQVQQLQTDSARYRGPAGARGCYHCGKLGHFKRSCPMLRGPQMQGNGN